MGIRVIDLLDKKVFSEKVKQNLEIKNFMIKNITRMKGFRREYHQDICRISEITQEICCRLNSLSPQEHRTEETHPLRGSSGHTGH